MSENNTATQTATPAGAIIYSKSAGRIRVRFAYSDELLQRVTQLKEKYKSARWIDDKKYWSFPEVAARDIIATFPEFPADPVINDIIADQIEMERQAEVELQKELAARSVFRNKLVAAAGDMTLPLPNGKTLYAHQIEAINFIFEHNNVIIAHDMGLGKTLSALMAAKAYHKVTNYPVWVVAPVSLKANWLREAQGVGLNIEVFSAAKIPTPKENQKYILIADEAHYYQTRTSQRTQRFLRLADGAETVILLTGTPMKNGRPVNLFPLLVATKHPLSRNRSAFEKRYCNARPTQWSRWDASGATNLDELWKKTQVETPVILRRTKKECLDLPEKTRVFREVEMAGEAKAQYEAVFNFLRTEYFKRLDKGEILEGGEALVYMNHLRHAGSMAKISAALEIIEELNEENRSAVVFTEFKTTAKALAAKLREKGVAVSLLTGETPSGLRDEEVQKFRRGDTKVFVSTLKAGGTGIDGLQDQCQDVILLDRAWTPGDCAQAEDRCHRIGQKNNVTALWLQFNDTDKAIDTLLERKEDRIEMVLHGKRKTLRGTGSIESVAKSVFEALMEDEQHERRRIEAEKKGKAA